jgi:alpha-L-arabinofuranosidase
MSCHTTTLITYILHVSFNNTIDTNTEDTISVSIDAWLGWVTGGLELGGKTPAKNRTPVRIKSLYSLNHNYSTSSLLDTSLKN